MTGTAIFTQPSASTVGALHAWQDDRNNVWNNRAVNTFSLSFSTDGGASYSSTVSGGPLTVVPGTDRVPHQTVLFARPSGVTHIRMLDMVNGGDPSYTGLGEIRFKRAGPPPPPAGTVMMVR